ncbi:hypothetical protein RW64_17365 [Geobacter sulfurreducens]|nr:hypothetical protein RW64_17365 [Geobacter sulfurreducens]
MGIKGLVLGGPLGHLAEEVIKKVREGAPVADEGENTLYFREDKDFYNRLDELVKGKHKVVIRFGTEKPGQDSKLWPRLRKCQNWDEIQHQLEQVQQGQSPEIAKIISPGMSAALTGGEILLIAWIALLLTGLLCYAIYKGYRAKVRGRAGKDGQPEGEIILEPPQG